MTDILDEIKEAIHETKTNKIIGRLTVGIFITGILLITYLGLSSWYTNHHNQIIEADGATLIKAVNSINTKNTSQEIKTQNIETLEKLAEQATSAYSALANIYLASIALRDTNSSKALYYYQRIIKDNKYDEIIREYITLVELNLKIQSDENVYDSVIKQLDEYFQPYINSDQSINQKISNDRIFSNIMLLSAISIYDTTKDYDKMQYYLEALKQDNNQNNNMNFVTTLLTEYIKTQKK